MAGTIAVATLAAWVALSGMLVAGFALLCLASDRHGPSGWARGSTWALRWQRGLRSAGLLWQALGMAGCVLITHSALGLVDYVSLALPCALIVIALATWAPRGLPGLAIAGTGVAALCAMLSLLLH